MKDAPDHSEAMQSWKITRDADGLATLTFDRVGETTNTLSQQMLVDLNEALDVLDRDAPQGLIIRSGKANGFIAGADVGEFGNVADPEAALAIVRRGWDTFERLSRVAYPTLALIKGFCLGGGLELALACRYRVVIDEPGTRLGLPEVMLGIVPGWGGIKRLPRLVGAPAALDLLLTGKTVDARRAKRMGMADECVPVRIMENTARGVLRARPAPRTLRFPLSLTLLPPVRRFIAKQAAKQVAKRARRDHYPAPYAILDLFTRYDGNALAVPASDPASIPSLLAAPTAANLIRVFHLQERLKALGKDDAFKATHVHVVGAGTMGGDIAAWCALRGLTVTLQDQSAERLAPAMKRAGALFAERLKDARRARDATDRLIPDVAGDGIARADVIIEAIFENLDAKRALFAEVEKKARPDAILATNTSSIPIEEIAS
ncbi:MAG: enoyl-CoA hydratase-related protein, partial [Casimicrobiaceae bacterium]